MPKFPDGLERGFGMIIEAVIVAAIFSAFIESGLIPKWVFVAFNIVSIVALVFLIDKSRYWSFGYLAGYVIGVVFSLSTLMSTEFLGILDVILYLGVAFGAVYLRVRIHT
ncbi:hypothetical protein [Salinirussus salinus]|uniref:hypothetical protein n=1 Tax=Salinirussus salinus TaxID=1198300 RepID=UPI001358B901|nr:hypothetical protein [Salinirussus salinus]